MRRATTTLFGKQKMTKKTSHSDDCTENENRSFGKW